MPVSVILGLQWGDEGKGKICDHLAEDFPYTLRFQGGNNAGHTIYRGERKIVLHLIPSGIFRSGTVNLIGPGVVLDVDVLLNELAELGDFAERPEPGRLLIDPACSVITAIHKECDRRFCGAIGTTGRGIGPVYEDLVGRRALRLGELTDPGLVRRRLEDQAAARGLDEVFAPQLASLTEALVERGRRLAPYFGDVAPVVDRALRDGHGVLAEGAQGTLLDVSLGTYPFVTSSSTTLGGLLASTGISYREIDRVYGIAKAYLTRVGNGPFPTELDDEVGDRLRAAGREFGSTTGRPRRCGWLDLPLLSYACRVNGVTDLVLTKVDVLAALPEGFRVADAYEGGLVVPHQLEQAKPRYRDFGPLSVPATGRPGEARQGSESTGAWADLLAAVEDAAAAPVRWVSVGPKREDVILR